MRANRRRLLLGILLGAALMIVLWKVLARDTGSDLSVTFFGLKTGGYVALGVTNKGAHEVAFQTIAVEYKTGTNWQPCAPTNWLSFQGYAWYPGTGKAMDIARPDEVPHSAAWRIRFICYRDDETDVGWGPRASWRTKLNGLARKHWDKNTFMFKSPHISITPEIPPE
jgi:hypothetical protein